MLCFHTRLVCFLLALLVSLAGCGDKRRGSSSSSGQATQPAKAAPTTPPAAGPARAFVHKRAYALTRAEQQFLADVRAKIAAGEDLNKPDAKGMTLLHRAAGRNYKTAVEALLAAGADVNARDNQSYTPLAIAAASGHTHVAEVLLQKGADPSVPALVDGLVERTPLALALGAKDDSMAELLRNYGASGVALAGAKPRAAEEFETKLKAALDSGQVNGVVDDKGSTLLHLAAARGNDAAVAKLLAAGADANIKDQAGQTPLYRAIAINRLTTVNVLMQKTNLKEKDKQGKTPDQYALECGHVQLAMLIQQRRNLNVWTAMTPKMMPGGMGTNSPMVGIGPYGRYNMNGTDEQKLAEAKQHLAGGGNVNAVNQIRATRLHDAARSGHVKTAAFLIEKGANLNLQDMGGNTPLHAAGMAGRADVIRLLLAKGANRAIRNALGQTPAQAAAAVGQQAAAQLIAQGG